jgi:hypothetical protein
VSVLIVLFGQENEEDGKLRFPALARCARAAEVYRELAPGSEVVVLPTGAYGAHFNTSEHPHFYYLTQELIRLGVPPENILPGAITSNTLQDCTEAWYRFKNGGHHKLVAVTSDYHAERVALTLGRLAGNDDAEIEVVAADTPSGYAGKDKLQEKQKVESLKRDWVNVIPRGSNVPPERFVAAYASAGREQHHYETLSMAVVAALLIVNAFAFIVLPGRGLLLTIVMLLALAIIDLVLWLICYRLFGAARTARRVLTRMEIEHRMPGPSSNRRRDAHEWFRSPPWLWSITELVTALTAVLFALVLLMCLLFTPGDRREETMPSKAVSGNSNYAASPTPVASGNGNALDRWTNRVLGSEENSNTNTNRTRRR